MTTLLLPIDRDVTLPLPVLNQVPGKTMLLSGAVVDLLNHKLPDATWGLSRFRKIAMDFSIFQF